MTKILIAEDESQIRNLIKLTLSFNKLPVTATKNGLEAVEVAASQQFDLIILDVRMPRLTGIEAAQQIRAHTVNAATPILFLSGENSITVDDICNSHILIKPFTVDTLLSKIDTILASSDEPTIAL